MLYYLEMIELFCYQIKDYISQKHGDLIFTKDPLKAEDL